jgi:hypothetical protein
MTAARRVVDNELVSTTDPAIRIRVDAGLRYLGATELEIDDLALAERHHFVDARDRHVRRMLVVQFEGFLASNDEVYRYRLPDPVTMGGEPYGRWTFCYSVAESAAPETADSVRLLESHGRTLDDAQIMARYARIVGDAARHELLIFYHEPLDRLGHSLASVSEDGAVREAYASLAIDLHARARRAFRVV